MEEGNKIRDGLYYLNPISPLIKATLQSCYAENNGKSVPAELKRRTEGLACFLFDDTSGPMEAGSKFNGENWRIERSMTRKDLDRIVQHYKKIIEDAQKGVLPDWCGRELRDVFIRKGEEGLYRIDILIQRYSL